MKKKIKENWKHIEEIEKLIKEKTGDPDAGFNASSLWLGKDGRDLMFRAMIQKKRKVGKQRVNAIAKAWRKMGY